MAEAFLAKSSPDPMFPCSTYACAYGACADLLQSELVRTGQLRSIALQDYIGGRSRFRPLVVDFALAVITDEKSAYDELGRCKLQCANCNCRMLFNQLKCVKADLETTKETLNVTANELDETMVELGEMKETLNITSGYLDDTMTELGEMKVALEEEKQQSNEDKRKFAGAIAVMVSSEIGDVRTQLTALNLCLKDELGEKSLAKAATSEAAKAALSASNYITLRLLMF